MVLRSKERSKKNGNDEVFKASGEIRAERPEGGALLRATEGVKGERKKSSLAPTLRGGITRDGFIIIERGAAAGVIIQKIRQEPKGRQY